MKKTKDRGITLIALVITIIILSILMSIVVNTASNSSKLAKYNEFENELETIQEKTNEIYEKNIDNLDKIDIGAEYDNMSNIQKKMLDKGEIPEISNIIYENVTTTDEENDIKKSFRYFTKKEISSDFNLDRIDNDYLISFKYRYVISTECYTYKDVDYYMIQQFNTGTYNVQYKPNSTTGSFDITSSVVGDNKWKIGITINYDGQINNWTVKYKKEDANFWQTSNSLNFFINEEGTYLIEVVHGDKIDLGQKTLTLSNS